MPLGERARRLEDAVSVLRGHSRRPVFAYGTEVVADAAAGPRGGTTDPDPRVGGARGAHVTAGIADGFIAGGDTPDVFGEQVRWAMDERDGRPFAIRPAHVDLRVERSRQAYLGRTNRYVSWEYDDMQDARLRSGPSLAPPRL